MTLKIAFLASDTATAQSARGALRAPVYGMNRGTIGFLMNEYSESNLQERLSAAEEEVVNPLSMKAVDRHGKTHHELAINEVSLLRAGPQAAKLKIHIDGRLLGAWANPPYRG